MFKSVSQVLNFAFTISESLICKTADYKDTVNGTGDRITPQDLHAQGAFIFNEMARLNEDEYTLIYAHYSYDQAVMLAAAKSLSAALLPIKILNADFALTMTRRHFDPIMRATISQRAVAYEHQVSQWQVQKMEKLVAAIMSPISLRAEAKLAAQFELSGLIDGIN